MFPAFYPLTERLPAKSTGRAVSSLAGTAAGLQLADRRCRLLFADAQFLDQGPVPVDILTLEIVEKVPALADQLEQTTAGMMILFVGLKMIGQIGNPLRQQCDLHLRRAGIGVMRFEFLNNLFFFRSVL
jgi:hypothetical protein